ncbi:MAG: cytochrome c3 family protein [Candidatus Aminicenantes bacterium]|nr:cytochrome c3 family protein [Candidatus Aminicenantes bacterium]
METKKEKKQGKFGLVLRLFKRNFIALHRLIWGKGWGKFIIAVAVTLVLLAALMSTVLEVTSTPRFCNTCHNMKPYYTSWLESSHKDVTCTDCHFPPGIKNKIKGKFTALSMVVNYFTGIYKRNKPWAEISDESCMRGGCHETRMLKGKVDFKKNIIFDHTPHLEGMRRGKKLRCTSCHSQIVQGTHMSVTETTCFLCHFKNTGEGSAISANQCTQCHTPPTSPAGKGGVGGLTPYDHTMVLEKKIACQKCHGAMVVGDGSVPKNRCNICHGDIEKIKLYSDTALMHKNHIADHKIECDQCHTEIQHKSVSRSEFVKPDCHACHPDFHNAQLRLFTGKGGIGVADQPSPMFEAGLNCQACHIFHRFEGEFKEKGETFRAGAGSCEFCHGSGYDKILENWKAQADLKVSQFSRILDAVGKIIEKNKNKKEYPAAKQKFADAFFNFNLVKYGNSIHNITFANRLMDKAYQLLEEGLKIVGAPEKLPDFERETGIVPGECSNCHTGIERKATTAFGWKFSHFIHLKGQGLSCVRCHSNEKKHGQLVISKQGCMDCHHQGISGGKQPECKNCHGAQEAVYFSRVDFSTFKVPNPMSGGVACVDCHMDEKNRLLRPGKAVCSKCHEKGYEAMFDEWQGSGLELLKKLREKVQAEKLGKGERAYEVLMLLEKDGSKGIHNPGLYEKLGADAIR